VLGLTVTAESLETEAQRDEVRAIGCESAQGYFYARPMPADAISEHLGAVVARPACLPASAVATA
jgi:EAL domain-containing protein (putative c-di-GMP-specific phosphodiesterase class I)